MSARLAAPAWRLVSMAFLNHPSSQTSPRRPAASNSPCPAPHPAPTPQPRCPHATGARPTAWRPYRACPLFSTSLRRRKRRLIATQPAQCCSWSEQHRQRQRPLQTLAWLEKVGATARPLAVHLVSWHSAKLRPDCPCPACRRRRRKVGGRWRRRRLPQRAGLPLLAL